MPSGPLYPDVSCLQWEEQQSQRNPRAGEGLSSVSSMAGVSLLSSGQQTRPAEAASQPSPHAALLPLLWLPATPSDSWIKSHCCRSCCCVLESPASLGFGFPAHNLPWQKPASKSSYFYCGPHSSGGRTSPGPAQRWGWWSCLGRTHGIPRVLNGTVREDVCPWP